MKNKTAAPPQRGRGRPKLQETGAHVLTLRLTDEQKATFDMLGRAAWLRAQLDRISHHSGAKE